MSGPVAAVAVVLSSVLVFSPGAIQAQSTSQSVEIDRQVWSPIAATVAADDIVGMGRLYFPEAVVVTPKATTPIKAMLEKWGNDMVAAKARGDKATVEFRFSLRQDDSTTAFEAGMFKYTVIAKAGTSTSQYIPFEALLGKSNGSWRVLMERQLPAVTQAEWDKLKK